MQVAPLDVATQPGRPRQRRFALQSSDGMVSFKTEPFTKRTEFTGHVTANLHVCIPAGQTGSTPSDIDLFVTIRHLDEAEKEIFYTGNRRGPSPGYEGLAALLAQKEPLVPGEVYKVTVEIWPTNVVVSPGNRLVFEIAGADTQGSGIFTHDHPKDRDEGVFGGRNEIRFGVDLGNYVTMPVIASASG
ncbi:hypothetical protein AnigIFM49718_003499 [Aspergillus niger]|nr:hypothetical protein AnigIFM49718_003499 [Aspergillus niger]